MWKLRKLCALDPARKQWHRLPTLFRKRRGKGWGTLTVTGWKIFNCRINRAQSTACRKTGSFSRRILQIAAAGGASLPRLARLSLPLHRFCLWWVYHQKWRSLAGTAPSSCARSCLRGSPLTRGRRFFERSKAVLHDFRGSSIHASKDSGCARRPMGRRRQGQDCGRAERAVQRGRAVCGRS